MSKKRTIYHLTMQEVLHILAQYYIKKEGLEGTSRWLLEYSAGLFGSPDEFRLIRKG